MVNAGICKATARKDLTGHFCPRPYPLSCVKRQLSSRYLNVGSWPTAAVSHLRRKLPLDMRGCSRERRLTGFVADSHFRPTAATWEIRSRPASAAGILALVALPAGVRRV